MTAWPGKFSEDNTLSLASSDSDNHHVLWTLHQDLRIPPEEVALDILMQGRQNAMTAKAKMSPSRSVTLTEHPNEVATYCWTLKAKQEPILIFTGHKHRFISMKTLLYLVLSCPASLIYQIGLFIKCFYYMPYFGWEKPWFCAFLTKNDNFHFFGLKYC